MIDYTVRAFVFLIFFMSLIAWQLSLPKIKTAPQHQGWKTRWFHNLSLFSIDILVIKLIQPLLLGLLSFHLVNQPFLYSDWLTQYPILSTVFAIAILDMAIYFQHRASHRIPILWRLHQVHHSDEKIDVSSAIRFHPLEIGFSLVYKAVIIYLFAIPLEAVLLFDILLNSAAMFNHTNARLSSKLDYIIRLFIVTPDMHRIHHSIRPKEANSNYGFFLSCWDRLFNSYTNTPEDNELTVGMPRPKHQAQQKNSQVMSLRTLLIMPLSNPFSQSKKQE